MVTYAVEKPRPPTPGVPSTQKAVAQRALRDDSPPVIQRSWGVGSLVTKALPKEMRARMERVACHLELHSFSVSDQTGCRRDTLRSNIADAECKHGQSCGFAESALEDTVTRTKYAFAVKRFACTMSFDSSDGFDTCKREIYPSDSTASCTGEKELPHYTLPGFEAATRQSAAACVLTVC